MQKMTEASNKHRLGLIKHTFSRVKHKKRVALGGVIISTLLLISPHVNANLLIREYQAEYELYWNGLPVGTSHHKVKELAPNHFIAQAHSFPKLTFLPFEDYERSEFMYNKQIRPQHYFFRKQENRKSEEGTLSFNWKNLSLTKNIKKKSSMQEPTSLQESISPTTHDRITHFFQLREDLKAGKPSLNYTVIEANKLNHWEFKIVGHETLETPIGALETIKLEHVTENKDRRTQFWLAKDLDYIMVKLVQFKHDKKKVDVIINKINYN